MPIHHVVIYRYASTDLSTRSGASSVGRLASSPTVRGRGAAPAVLAAALAAGTPEAVGALAIGTGGKGAAAASAARAGARSVGRLASGPTVRGRGAAPAVLATALAVGAPEAVGALAVGADRKAAAAAATTAAASASAGARTIPVPGRVSEAFADGDGTESVGLQRVKDVVRQAVDIVI